MSRYECEGCGLTAMDLPDGVDLEFIFERDEDGVMLCQGCQQLPGPVRRCARCRDAVQYLSSHDLCDGCEYEDAADYDDDFGIMP